MTKAKDGKREKPAAQVPIELYDHKGKTRLNNPPVPLVDPNTDPDLAPKTYSFDPHLDPTLYWTGKTESTSFEVPTVSLHTHEFIDPRAIIESVRKTNTVDYAQLSLFNKYERTRPLHKEIEFYKHSKNWINRLIAGDSLLVMNSLLEKEGMSENVQMIYFDPPYGIKYGSNFQPFVGKIDVKDKSDADLTGEPETLRAFRDTWEFGIHSYLTHLRDRMFLAKKLLTSSGSVFVQIGDENVHFVRTIMDDIFGRENFCSQIALSKTGGLGSSLISGVLDYILWYAKDIKQVKYRQLYNEKKFGKEGTSKYTSVELPDGTRRPISSEEKAKPSLITKGSRCFRLDNMTSQGNPLVEFKFEGKTYKGTWKTTVSGMNSLAKHNRIVASKNSLNYVRYLDDFPCIAINNYWQIGGIQSRSDPKIYVVQTATEVIKRCVLMTTDPGDLIFDPTCGSGTSAVVAEQWGRRWVTCDTSRVAVTLAKQRLMTSDFDYYALAQPGEGIDSGLQHQAVNRTTLGSIANGQPAETVILYDRPRIDSKKIRVTGPFTVEAVPAPMIRPLNDSSRSGITSRMSEWRDELYKTGIRGKNKQVLGFSRLELLAGTRWLHAEGEVKSDSGAKVVISFGPDYAPLEQRQVAMAVEEAQAIVPKPKIIVFASFQFDPEAAKDIDELNWPEVQIIKAQMNPDLFTSDLKKKRTSNESFWLMGQPDVDIRKISSGEYKGQYKVEVHGFDYFNPSSGEIESGGTKNIAMWMLDTDYDGRSLFPRQVFFPMGSAGAGWKRLARTLRTEIDEELIEAYQGTVSIPFEEGKYKRVAVKIIDDRGIESLRIINLENDS